jgi:hypothetical protein
MHKPCSLDNCEDIAYYDILINGKEEFVCDRHNRQYFFAVEENSGE